MLEPRVFIKSINFNDDSSFHFSPNDKVLFVGANNSGKSQTLRDVMIHIKDHQHRPMKVVASIGLDKSGTSAQLKSYLDSKAVQSKSSYLLGDWEVNVNEIEHWDNFPDKLIGDLYLGYTKTIDAEKRLSICALSEAPQHGKNAKNAQQYIYNSDSAAQEVSDLFYAAFDQQLFFDYRGGQHIPLHVGTAPDRAAMPDRVSDAYVSAVRKEPLLCDQGDGMKAYAGILLESIATAKNIILLDEPEAFLHPPQMRKLGETLATKVQSQLFVATHSSDVLRGFLEGTKGSVRILRIDREDDKNFVREVPSDVVRELWEQPALRYSNAFDAIFHEQAIICEDDSDCRLYNAMESHLSSNEETSKIDTAYVPAGGKAGVPRIAAALRSIGVPTKAIFDLDFLNDKTLVKKTVTAFGGDWSGFEQLYSNLTAAVTSGITPKTVDEIKRDIIDLLGNDPGLPKSKVKELLGQDNSWNTLKAKGVLELRGDAHGYFSEIERRLANLGIFIVPVGEAENFCRSIGAHGPKFVTQLLERSLDDNDLRSLREFVQLVIPKPIRRS